MMTETLPETSAPHPIYPQVFSTQYASPYLADPLVRKLLEFFEKKGLAALKDEDRREQWYEDWLEYQARHKIYAQLLTPSNHLVSLSPGHPVSSLNLLTL